MARDKTVVPHLIGPRIPKRTSDRERWSHVMLTLFKPWRSGTELRNRGEKWSEAYQRWEDSKTAPLTVLQYLANLKDMHAGQSQQ
jgi:hypothetical protein